jgi:hypothetical protein
LPAVPRHPRLTDFLAAVALGLIVAIVAGCNVLFVPRKPVPSPTDTPNPVVHAYPALEARLPDVIDGKVVQKFSLPTDPTLETPKTLEVLRRLGKTTSDLQLAKGSVNGEDFALSALRIVGADAIQAAVAFESVDENDPQGTSTYQPATVAGKRVLIRTTGDLVAYVYPLDDVVFVVSGDRAFVEETLTKIR